MKTNNEEIDQLIRQALSEEEAKFYDQLEEQSLPQMVGGLFQGKMRWITIMTFIIMPIMFAGAVYCMIQFYQSTETRDMIIWCTGGLLLMLGVSFLKLFHWLQMDKNAILRELKRLELQVAILNSKLEKK